MGHGDGEKERPAELVGFFPFSVFCACFFLSFCHWLSILATNREVATETKKTVEKETGTRDKRTKGAGRCGGEAQLLSTEDKQSKSIRHGLTFCSASPSVSPSASASAL